MKNTNAVIPLSLALISTATMAQKTVQQPNIIYILADDLGYGDVGCYGQQLIKTPNIDKLAANGMLFTQHYAGCTVSAPSRSALMTGLHTGHTPIRGNQEHKPEGQLPLPAGTFTLAKMLKQQGYITAAFGKWGLGYPSSEGNPNEMGFDEFFGYNCQREAHNYYPDHLYHNNDRIELTENKNNKTSYSPDLIQQQALSFLKKNGSHKFFLYLPYTLPHAQVISPNDSILQQYLGKIAERKTPTDPSNISPSNYPHAHFAAMVSRLDAYVGEIVAAIKKQGIEQNTIIIFTSDNGPHAEGGGDPRFFGSSGNLRGIKRDLYEGGIRVPMIVYWPTKIKAGSKSDLVSSFWDILPTMADVCGYKMSNKTDGISFVPTLLASSQQKEHDFLYWEFHEGGGKIAVRKGNWKGIKLNYGKDPKAPMLLFNLSTDIHEDNNVAARYPQIVAELESIIKKEHINSTLFPFGKNDE